MNKIIFFNHYHKGDMHTNKEFIRQIISELKNVQFEYQTNNPQKLLDELNLKITNGPERFDSKKPLYKNGDTLCINTWVGCFWDVFCKHGGINMHTLYEQWDKLFAAINKVFNTSLTLKSNKENYLPKIDYGLLNTKDIDEVLNNRESSYKMLVCNNQPHSGQSFMSNMQEFVVPLAKEYPDVDFICTNKFPTLHGNILFTDDITNTSDNIDLLEISYISTKVNVIVGKNSGPYVFCETYDNYMDPNKTFISFNKKHPDYDDIKETMSNGLDIKCKYSAVPINDIYNLSESDSSLIMETLRKAMPYEKT